VKILVDEDSVSTTLLTRLKVTGYDIVQLPTGTSDEEVFAAAQRLAIPVLTANVGRKGRRDPTGLYRLALERTPHHGVIGIFRPGPDRWLSDQLIVDALNLIMARERAQPGLILRTDGITRLNDFLSST
jgi:hypothetical protein